MFYWSQLRIRRYDLKLQLKRFVNIEETCEYSVFQQPPICNERLKVIYYETPPYIHRLENGNIGGILPAILSLALQSCCNNCTHVTYLHGVDFWSDFSNFFNNESFYSILMPVLAVKNENEIFGKPFMKLMNNPGVVYIQLDDQTKIAMSALLNSILSTWPLFVVLMLLTFQGGIVIWLLEMRKNTEEFPRGFVTGILEGGWWAYVSMTTVGYGDKTPKSYLARLFSVFWITLGIAISGMFTASLSSSLTSAMIQEKQDLTGLKVGIPLKNSLGYEENVVHKEGGIPISYMNDTQMIHDLETRRLNGIVLDRFVFNFTWRKFQNSGLKLAMRTDIPKSDTEIGLMFSGNSYEKWSVFLGSFFKANADAESRFLSDAVETLPEKVSTRVQETARSGNIFASSTVTSPLITALGVAACALFIFGFVFRCIYRFTLEKSLAKVQIAKSEIIEMKQAELKSFKTRTLSI
ncbi:uncharacterized protein LOC135691358 isoform X2 [Rhopilema esculentum]|uniref:uncharacterized protein LOC135691358 isoform X2 n=1 Tax=Rhopilema esculentum TaxID=499914 RepID=UPI0031DD638B